MATIAYHVKASRNMTGYAFTNLFDAARFARSLEGEVVLTELPVHGGSAYILQVEAPSTQSVVVRFFDNGLQEMVTVDNSELANVIADCESTGAVRLN